MLTAGLAVAVGRGAATTTSAAAGAGFAVLVGASGSELEGGKTFRFPEDGLKESQKDGNIRIRAVTRRPESVRQHRERKLLCHLERKRRFLRRRSVALS